MQTICFVLIFGNILICICIWRVKNWYLTNIYVNSICIRSIPSLALTSGFHSRFRLCSVLFFSLALFHRRRLFPIAPVAPFTLPPSAPCRWNIGSRRRAIGKLLCCTNRGCRPSSASAPPCCWTTHCCSLLAFECCWSCRAVVVTGECCRTWLLCWGTKEM